MYLSEKKILADLVAAYEKSKKMVAGILGVVALIMATVVISDKGWGDGSAAGLIVMVVAFGFLAFALLWPLNSQRKAIEHPDIRITEDIIIDKYTYSAGRNNTVYATLGLSGKEYRSSDLYDNFYTPLEPIYVVKVYAGKEARTLFYPKTDCKVEEKLKVAESDLPSELDPEVLAHRLTELFYGSDLIRLSADHVVKNFKCPECGKNLRGGTSPRLTCKHCGAEFTLRVRDLMHKTDWYENEFGDAFLEWEKR